MLPPLGETQPPHSYIGDIAGNYSKTYKNIKNIKDSMSHLIWVGFLKVISKQKNKVENGKDKRKKSRIIKIPRGLKADWLISQLVLVTSTVILYGI